MLKDLARIPLAERITYFDTRTLPLHAMLGSIGHARETKTRYDWDGLKRGRTEFVLFQYTISGAGRMMVGGAEHEVGPGMAMLLHFPAENRYWLPASSPHWEFIYLCLHGREVMRLWAKIEQGYGAIAKLEADSAPVKQAAEIIRLVLRGKLGSPFAASALAYQWLMTMLDAAPKEERASPHAEALERARRFAESRFAEPLGVDDLAKVAGFSRFHFTRLFTAHVGSSPTAWLVDLRVKEAARLLRETRLPLKEVAARSGFKDAGYLGNVFLARTGQPPGSYRRSGV